MSATDEAVVTRDNTKSNGVVARQNTTRQLADYIDLLLIHPNLGSVDDKGRANLEELTPEEAV